MSSLLRRIVLSLMLLMFCVSTSVIDAKVAHAATGGDGYAPVTYVGTAVANVAYFPAKLLFATSGAVTSAVTYLVTFGSEEPSRTIWNTAVHGDYIVTPDMIAGNEPIRFAG